jgi:hypothetical protein
VQLQLNTTGRGLWAERLAAPGGQLQQHPQSASSEFLWSVVNNRQSFLQSP